MKPNKSAPIRSNVSRCAINPAGGRLRGRVLALALFSPAYLLAAPTVEKFTTAGTFSWACPVGVTSVQVECWGGGGAGGGSFINGGSANAGGGGGGGGAYAKLTSVPVTPGITYTVTIPAAATCPASGFLNNDRFNGSAVSFTGDAVTVTANGGQGGQCRIVTTATASTGGSGVGGAAGTGLDGFWAGGNGGTWSAGNASAGGGGAGDLGAGGVATPSTSGSFGAGGSGSDADHAGGNGGAARNGAGTGSDASNPGGGGGGAKSTTTSTTSRRGGNGGLGRIILTYTVPSPPFKTKAANTVALNEAGSWVDNQAPSTSDVAKWTNIVDSPNTTALEADLTWAGIAIENPNGLVTINGPNILTLGAAAVDIDLSAATADLRLNCPLALDAVNTWDVAATRTLTLGGQVSGAFDITKVGAGTLQLGASNVLPDGAGNGNLSVTGTLDLNGNSETINSLSGSGIIDNLAATTNSTLTLNSTSPTSTFSGSLRNTASTATLNLIKTGAGTQTLSGANTLSGAVSITGGTLVLGNIAPFPNISGISMGDTTALRADVADAVIDAPITLGAAGTTSTIQTPNVAGSGTTAVQFNLDGAISGDGDLTLKGIQSNNAYATINLKAASNYNGSTLLTCSDELASPTTLGNQNIFVKLFTPDALPVTTVLTLDGGDGAPLASAPGRYCEFNLNGRNQTIAGLTNVTGRTLRVQRVVNSATDATLTVNNAGNHTYSGQLGWVSGFGSAAYNNFNLTKNGVGVQTLSGSLRYDGNTTVNGGTLSLGSNNANNDLSTVTIATSGAFLNLNFGGSDTVDKLVIGGIQQAAGVYGALESGAQFEVPQIQGTGTLSVTTGPVGFSSWIAGTFINGPVPSGQQGPNDDFDNDGISNLVEYAVKDQDPTVSDASIGTFNGTTLSFDKRLDATGLTYAIQQSTDLGVGDDWTQVTPPNYVNDGTTISYALTPGTPAKNFLRLQVLSN